MTAPTVRPLSRLVKRPQLRVLPGRDARRPAMGPWLLFSTIAILAFFAIIWSRTTLDRTAFELQELEGRIAAEQARYGELRLEVARLESPSRIAPLAEEMGMVFPSDTQTVAADGVERAVGSPRRLAELSSILSASSP